MPDENYQNLSNLSSNISYLLIETFEKYLLDKSKIMEDLKFAYFFKIKDPCKIFSIFSKIHVRFFHFLSHLGSARISKSYFNSRSGSRLWSRVDWRFGPYWRWTKLLCGSLQLNLDQTFRYVRHNMITSKALKIEVQIKDNLIF